jgi:hypothetical protein
MQPEIIENAIKMPGAVAAVSLLSVILPALNIFPDILTLPMIMAFSIPTLWIFILSVIANREVPLGKNIALTVFLSYVLYIISRYPFDVMKFYMYSFFFLLGASLGAFSYTIYYIFFLLGKSSRLSMNYRERFVFSFIPTILLIIALSMVINLLFGQFIFNVAGGLA